MTTNGLFLIHDSQRIQVQAVTSDTHFGHKNIAKYTGRPFDNSESTFHMDSTLFNNWNSVVSADETVLHLGDAALGKIEVSLLNYERLNGVIALIPGNHDEIASVSRAGKARRERLAPVYERVFDWILPETGVTLEAVRAGEVRVIQASHYPSFGDSHDRGKVDRFARLRPNPDNGPIIHGHTHAHQVHQPGIENEFHVGVDAHNLSPVRSEVIIDWVFSLRAKTLSLGEYSLNLNMNAMDSLLG